MEDPAMQDEHVEILIELAAGAEMADAGSASVGTGSGNLCPTMSRMEVLSGGAAPEDAEVQHVQGCPTCLARLRAFRGAAAGVGGHGDTERATQRGVRAGIAHQRLADLRL